jgi:hypothetical protein
MCGFETIYYANNGTWICNATVYDNKDNKYNSNISTVIQPLYAVNISDTMIFGDAKSSIPSINISVNITNFGNMPVNITLQGYAISIGDNTAMNCSDNTNISIENVKFTTNPGLDFDAKTPLSGGIQNLDLQVLKQINSTQIFNTTYWQISPNPGTIDRICSGYVIFNAMAP